MVTTVLSTCEDANKHWSPSLQGDTEMQSQLSLSVTSGSLERYVVTLSKPKSSVSFRQVSCICSHRCSYGCCRPKDIGLHHSSQCQQSSFLGHPSANPSSILLFRFDPHQHGPEIQKPTLSPLGLGGKSRL